MNYMKNQFINSNQLIYMASFKVNQGFYSLWVTGIKLKISFEAKAADVGKSSLESRPHIAIKSTLLIPNIVVPGLAISRL